MDIALLDYPTGATVATALVNTSPTVRPEGDGLPDPESLAEFLAEHDVRLDAVTDREPTDDDLYQVHLLRREVRGILETETADQAVAGAHVLTRRAALGPVLRRAGEVDGEVASQVASQVDGQVDGGGRWQWHVPTAPGAPLADQLAAFVGVGLLGVVRMLGHDRFRACEASGCRGVFADTSRAGRRRYCTPERCGNRVNVANHRARQRLGSGVR